MPHGTPEPALQPLHPDKPEPPIVVGAVWRKKASRKTTVNAPRCRVEMVFNKGRSVRVWVRLDDDSHREHTERVFRRDWEPA